MSDESATAAAAFLVLCYGYKLLLKKKKPRQRRWWITSVNNSRKKYNGSDLLIDMVKEPSTEFFNFCRMSREDFQYLLDSVGPVIYKRDTKWRKAIPIQERLAITLRFLATGDSFQSLHYLFKVSPQIISEIVPEVCRAIIDVLMNHIKLISEINSQVALFRDLLIHIGTSKDCPEMREKIRKLRRNCVDACKHTCQLLLPQIRSSLAEGIPMDHPHLVFLFFMCQLFLRELAKCSRLVQLIPMDMSGYFENRAGPSNIGNVISQILLCKQIAPDFNQEEVCSIAKDSQELTRIIQEIQEFLPQQDMNAEKGSALVLDDGTNKWTRKRRRNSLYNNVGSFCCFCRPNYL